MKTETHRHPNRKAEEVPAGVGLIPFLSIVAQEQQRLDESQVPCFEDGDLLQSASCFLVEDNV